MELLSQMWSLLGLLTVLQNVLPSQLLSLLHSFYESLQDFLTPYSYFDVPEFDGYCGVDVNHLYRHVNLYLNSLNTSSNAAAAVSCRRLTLSRSKSSNRITFTVAPNHTVHDTFRGHCLSWTHHVDTVQDSLEEKRSFSLKLPKRHRHALLSPYLDFLISRAEDFERVSRDRRLFTNNGRASWVSVPFRHPSTFQTLALEPRLRDQLTQDLQSFADGKDFYRRVGRAWKRGYLLHGPPGSGKSSLIAAMANFLCYDVYDLELTKVSDNSELRALLIQTTNRSIIVIEDIDCSVDLTADRQSKWKSRKSRERTAEDDEEEEAAAEEGGRVTLSGLLNFTDGLWSCCGEERIIVFTTNHRDNVDPALVRCGRMDVHVNLGTCGIEAFKALAANYLGLGAEAECQVQGLMEVVESCIRAGGALTPAQIGEILLRNRSDPDAAMRAVVSAMQGKILRGSSCNNQQRPETEGEMMETTETDNDVDQVGAEGMEKGLMEWPDNWEPTNGSGRKNRRRKRKEGTSTSSSSLEKKVNFLARLKSLTKSDSGRRGV